MARGVMLSHRVIDVPGTAPAARPVSAAVHSRRAFRPGIDLAALCGPRGLGKSSLSGELLSCALDPDGPLFEAGSESVLLAGSLDQARAAFRFLRARCPESRGFKYTDSGQRVSVNHKATNTRVRVASSSDAKRAFGIVGARLMVGDEPAAWQERGGAMMFDALSTAGGKNEMLLLLIGTLAPGSPTGWWHKLIETGNGDPGVYVQVHRAPVDTDGEVQDWSRNGRRSSGAIRWWATTRILRRSSRTNSSRRAATTTRGGNFSVSGSTVRRSTSARTW